MSIGNIYAIFKKQLKDILKNKEILIQFVMFPILTVIMENSIHMEGMPPHYFVTMFATMYIGMAPLIAMASILSEEREKNTLRMLIMSDVTPAQYLIGTGSSIWLLCMSGSLVFALMGEYQGLSFLKFLLVMGLGILIAIFLGAAIGAGSKNQMTATSVTVPTMLVISFLPMISSFNPSVEKVARFLYAQQLSSMLSDINTSITAGSLLIVGGNLSVILALFIIAYRKILDR